MNNNEKLLDFIGDVDEDFIPELKQQTKHHTKKNRIRTWITTGGICAAAMLGLFIYLSRYVGLPPTDQPINRIYPAFDLEPASKELVTLSSQFEAESMGFEGLLAYDIAELANQNPWSVDQNLSSLPVFRNLSYTDSSSGGIAVYLSEEDMKVMAENVAATLGTSITGTRYEYVKDIMGDGVNEELANAPYSYEATCDGKSLGIKEIEISIFGNGDIRIGFSESIQLPKQYSFTHSNTDNEQADDTLQYLTKKFSKLLQFDSPTTYSWADRDIYGEENRSYYVYNSSEDTVENILGYNFTSASFAPDDQGNLMLIWLTNALCASECLGEYPIITADTAQNLLIKGEYITSVPTEYLKNGEIAVDDIKKTELVYLVGREEYYQPYYRFYVELSENHNGDLPEGLKVYGAFYVPAVSGEYLVDYPAWDGSFN
ncbi:hypothetical protein [Anaerosporobacter faecicola]|uniref:hypothetical protein n=1 Tax=Anaerosporobacter faecicola TaxID=2718714 RepID=UPI00143BEA95|nr:hypothetical protein [Anaerosporobacter faecicola]